MSNSKTYAKLPVGEFELDYLRESATAAREHNWERLKWFRRPALFDHESGSIQLFVGESYDPGSFELKLDGWTHDH